MNFDLTNLSQRLTQKKEVFAIIDDRVKDLLFSPIPKNFSYLILDDIIKFYAKDNVDEIFNYATSDVEKVFFSSILIYGLNEGIFFLQFTQSTKAALKAYETNRAYNKSVMQIWEDFRRQTGEESMDVFLVEYVFKVDLPERIKVQIMRSLKMSFCIAYHTFFLTIKSGFDEILFKGKPIETDIFVWSMYDPNFRLLVECDELGYFPDQSTFSSERARDRFLQSNGFQVFRFSGKEIISNPLGKAKELVDFLKKQRAMSFLER